MCPGLYCGRNVYLNGTLSHCGACRRGYTPDASGRCALCENDLSNYDMLFLGFMFMLPLMMHCYFIGLFYDKIKEQLTLVISTILELLTSAFASALLMNPVGSLHIHTCGVKRLSDWYTLFYNPSPNYQSKLYCTHEAVYPLQTIVLLFYFFSLLQLLGIKYFFKKVGIQTNATYSALYFFPLLIFLHATSCGLIYYAFPYLSIILSMLTNAWHQASKLNDSTIKSITWDVSFLLGVAGNWCLLAYGIISLKMQLGLLIFVPLPLLFYYATKHLSDPMEFLDGEEGSN